jgi:membrane protease YdiL (CAAX protease family)
MPSEPMPHGNTSPGVADDRLQREQPPLPTEPVMAIIEDPPQVISDIVSDGLTAKRPTLPQPNLLFAMLLAALPIVVQAVMSIAVFIAVLAFTPARQSSTDSMEQVADSINAFLLPIATFSNLMVAVAVVAIAFGRQAPRRVAWRNCTLPQWIATLLCVIPLAVIASEVSNCASDVLSRIEPAWLTEFSDSNGKMFADFANESWVLVFVGACLLPGLSEELYCRGFISRGLVARYGIWFGSIFASLLFGIMHLEPIQATSAFVLGLALQYLFMVTRSLPAAITLHLLNNFGAFLVMRLGDRIYIPGLSLSPDETTVHTPPLLLAAAIFAVIALGGILFQMRTRWLLPDGSKWSPGYVTTETPPAEAGAKAHSDTPSAIVLTISLATYAAFLVLLVLSNQPTA